MAKEATVTVTLTKAELWELKTCFELSFEGGLEENKLADRVLDKLSAAYAKVIAK